MVQFTARRPFAPAAGGLRLAVRLQPAARRNAVAGLAALAEGGVALKVQVTAPPEGGKANRALIALLAKTWRLPKGAFRITAGHVERNKRLLIAGAPAEVAERIETWLAAQGSFESGEAGV